MFLSGLFITTGCKNRDKEQFSVVVDENLGLSHYFESYHENEAGIRKMEEALDSGSMPPKRICMGIKNESDETGGMHMEHEIYVKFARIKVKDKEVVMPVYELNMMSKSGGFGATYLPCVKIYKVDGEFCFEMPVEVLFAKVGRMQVIQEARARNFTEVEMYKAMLNLGEKDTAFIADGLERLKKEGCNMISKTFLFRNTKDKLLISSSSGVYNLEHLREDFGPGKYTVTVFSDIMEKPVLYTELELRKPFPLTYAETGNGHPYNKTEQAPE